jgi:hypothetical protein
MVERREELHNVKHDHACLETPSPSCLNQMSKVQPSIFSGLLHDPSKLVQLKNSMLDTVKLDAIQDTLLNKFSHGVQEHNGPEHLGSRVC